MCGRFALKTPLGKWLFELFGEPLPIEIPNVQPRYNIAPTQSILIATRHSADGKIHLEFARWGLIPSWAKELRFGAPLINARSETLATKPIFRTAFEHGRCAVIADGYYEWQVLDPKQKQPLWMHRPNEMPFVMAGLAASNDKIEPDHPIRSATIVTTRSNARLSNIHDRMPVILDSQKKLRRWLSHDPISQSQCLSDFGPAPTDYLEPRPVSSWVGNPRHEEPRCIEAQPILWQRTLGIDEDLAGTDM